MLKLKLQYFGHPMRRTDLLEKDPDAGKDWRQEEKGMTEDEVAGWHHRLDGHEFEWTPGVGDGQGGLVCCRPWGRKQSDMTERWNWTEDKFESVSQCQVPPWRTELFKRPLFVATIKRELSKIKWWLKWWAWGLYHTGQRKTGEHKRYNIPTVWMTVCKGFYLGFYMNKQFKVYFDILYFWDNSH